MNIIWQKVWRDLIGSKTRTFLVVLSTAVGIFALGLVISLSNILTAQMTSDYQKSIPSQINFWGGEFDQGVIDAIQKSGNIAAAEGETILSIRWKLPGEKDWRRGNIIALRDYTNQRINLVDLIKGEWPGRRDFSVERQSALYFNIPIDSSVIIEFGNSQRSLPITGIIRSPNILPPQFGGDAAFYAAPETITWLTGFEGFNQLHISLKKYSLQEAESTAKSIQSRFDRIRLPYGGYTISSPDQHWMHETVDTLALILFVLGILALGVSAFLIINTMNAIIAQQVWQIGVMKVIGATSKNMVQMYLLNTLIYSIFSILIAVPASIFASSRIAFWLLNMININFNQTVIIPNAAAVQILVGLSVPILAALGPILKAARITPHDAISSHGLGLGFGFSKLDQLVEKIKKLPSILVLGLRNTLRRKTRILLTLLTLTLAGVMFIVVMSVSTSLDFTLEKLISNLGLDVWVVFPKAQSIEYLTEVAYQVPGVLHAEIWDQKTATLNLPNGEDKEIYLMGLPPDSQIFHPQLVDGRNLLPEEEYAILLNKKIASDENISVGDQIKLKIGAKESYWTVVGLILDVSQGQTSCFVPINGLGKETGHVRRGTILMAVSDQHGLQNEHALIEELQSAYISHGIRPSFLMSASEIRLQNKSQFNIIIYLMLAMAALSALVGGIGLTGTMFINIVERRREIGVMRSIGATSQKIIRIIVTEGLFIGLLSWLIALPISIPGSMAFSSVIGETLILVPLNFHYSLNGTFLWLIIVLLLSALASIWPALQAVQVSVREALAYE